jgi:hypothetical protein
MFGIQFNESSIVYLQYVHYVSSIQCSLLQHCMSNMTVFACLWWCVLDMLGFPGTVFWKWFVSVVRSKHSYWFGPIEWVILIYGHNSDHCYTLLTWKIISRGKNRKGTCETYTNSTTKWNSFLYVRFLLCQGFQTWLKGCTSYVYVCCPNNFNP